MDMARVEAGLFMLDVDYTPAHHAWMPGQKSSPYEMGLGWAVNLDKPGYFVGRRALEREHREGPAWKFVGVEVEWDSLERAYAAVGLPPQIPTMAVRGSLPVLQGWSAGRLCFDQHVVARAQEIRRARAPAASVLRARHEREPRDHGGAPSTPGRRTRRRAAVLRARVEEEVARVAGSNNDYDAIVIGAGHNGMIAAAYLARAGKKVVVLERRELVGGAAVTEEIFPGYRFSEFSYVVSLLRPEIIRDLELPKHGLKILPLPSTVTPMENGDYLAGWDDHDLTRREIYRHSPLDAEAYDEYSRVMARAAKAIKPIIGLVPPDPSSMSWRDLKGLLKLGRYGAGLTERQLYRISKLVTQSSADLLEEWFELDALKGTKAASGIIGTFLGPRSPGTAYVLLHHYMGEIDGAFRAWGFAKNGTGGVSAADRLVGPLARGRDPHPRTGAERDRARRSRRRRRARERGRTRGEGRAVGDRSQAQFPAVRRRASIFPDEFTAAIRNFRVRGSSGKVNLALSELPHVHLPARRRPAASRRNLHQPEHRLRRARLRRREVRPVLAPALHGHHHPVDDRPRHGAAGPPRHVVLRAVRAVRRRGRLGRCEARSVRRDGDLDHRAPRAEYPSRDRG